MFLASLMLVLHGHADSYKQLIDKHPHRPPVYSPPIVTSPVYKPPIYKPAV